MSIRLFQLRPLEQRRDGFSAEDPLSVSRRPEPGRQPGPGRGGRLVPAGEAVQGECEQPREGPSKGGQKKRSSLCLNDSSHTFFIPPFLFRLSQGSFTLQWTYKSVYKVVFPFFFPPCKKGDH